MVTVEVSTRLTVEDLVAAADQLPNQALTDFVRRVLALQVQRGLPFVEAEDEQALLRIIEAQHLLDSEQKRLTVLRQKSSDGTLTADEHAELLQFVQRVEEQNVIRIEALIELSHKRGVTLQTLMRQLGTEPDYA